MARRKANDGLTVVLLLLALALAYVAPFVIIGFWAYYEYQARIGVGHNIQAGSEHSELRQQLTSEIAITTARIAQLLQEGSDQGLNRRQDGMFDARFAEGRELNALIEAETVAQLDARQQLTDIVQPLLRRDAFRGAVIGYFGMLLLFWSRSVDQTPFWMSVWASVVAVIAGLITYALRKSHYAN